MLVRFNHMTAAVLSGIAASLTIVSPSLAAQEKPVVVYAEPQEDVRTERVTYADLNLTQLRDQRKLKVRVAGAVQRVCLFENSRIGLQDRGYYHCAGDAWNNVNPQIAQAVARATEIAMTGHSSIAPRAIRISVSGS